MASRSALLQEVKRKRAAREAQKQNEEDAAEHRRLEEDAASCIQSAYRGTVVRRRWSDEEWQSLQKQVRDLDKISQTVKQKGQHFVAPCKIILPFMVRSLWQQRRAVEELALLCGTLAVFVAAALLAPMEDTQKSLCYQIGAEVPSYAPEPGKVLLTFVRLLLAVVSGTRGAAGAHELANILDVRLWGQGRALDAGGQCAAVASALLVFSALQPCRGQCGDRRLKRTPGLQDWRAGTSAAVGLWSGGVAAAPDRLKGLVGTMVSWLRLVDGTEPHAAQLLEGVVTIPRIGQLLAAAQAAGSGHALPWEKLLRSYAKSLRSHSQQEAGEDRKAGSAKMLDREYALVYASGNLWELYTVAAGSGNTFPLEPLLHVQAILTEHVEVSMLAASSLGDEPLSVQALRQQLSILVDPSAVTRLFHQALHLSQPPTSSTAGCARRAELARMAQGAYQRHCLAVALHEVTPSTVEPLCRIYSILLLKARTAMRAARGTGVGPQVFSSIANTIAYMENGDVVRVLWRYVQGFHGWLHCESESRLHCESESRLGGDRGLALQSHAALDVLHLQATLLSQFLSVTSDEELRGPGSPLRDQDFADYILSTTRFTAQLAWTDDAVSPGTPTGLLPAAPAPSPSVPRGPLADAVMEQLSRVLSQLHTFAGRMLRPPAPDTWHAPSEILREFRVLVEKATVARDPSLVVGRAERLLKYAPHSVPFEQRVALLRLWTQEINDRSRHMPCVRLLVRRTHLFEDGLAALADANWHARFQVVFVNAAGRHEQGQDAGGLFKEFLEKLAETSFNPDYGLFSATESRLLFPNPEAHKYHDSAEKLFEFLGLVIGKAIFEGIVVEPCFAPFFLAKLLGKHNSYYDLQSLDPALFANLQRLKGYDGNVEDMCCSFVASAADGREVPLLPDGQNIPVTNENRFRYVYLLSNFKLNVELKAASEAFLSGFKRLIDERWLRMFGEDELQQVISGSKGSGIDIEDLRKHTNLSNCSGPKDKMVVDFFCALKAMRTEHLVGMLRFVTSCSRTPLLGFGHLVPPFTIHKVPIRSDSEKLPTASTCFNTLKLPTYSSWKVMKQKLEYVIEQGAGFELD